MTEAGETPHFPPLFHTNTLAHALQTDAFSGTDLRLAPGRGADFRIWYFPLRPTPEKNRPHSATSSCVQPHRRSRAVLVPLRKNCGQKMPRRRNVLRADGRCARRGFNVRRVIGGQKEARLDRRSPINSALQFLPREKTATDGILQIKTATPGASDTAVFLEDALTLYPR